MTKEGRNNVTFCRHWLPHKISDAFGGIACYDMLQQKCSVRNGHVSLPQMPTKYMLDINNAQALCSYV